MKDYSGKSQEKEKKYLKHERLQSFSNKWNELKGKSINWFCNKPKVLI